MKQMRRLVRPLVVQLVRRSTKVFFFFSLGVLLAVGEAFPAERVVLPSGRFTPLYGLEKNQKEFRVPGFKLDRDVVTKQEFAEFVVRFPEWRPDRVKRLLAEEKYLQDWKKDARGFRPLKKEDRFPVVNVSYFAAQAYCQWKGGRLPSTLEWEYAAAASEKKKDASRDPEFAAKILAWYSAPGTMREIGQSRPNLYGLRDMHALVWEWTSDYNSSFVTSDSRQDGEKTKDFFCGNSATGAENREAYAAFMRYAMRGTLNPSYTIEKLGFRCAYEP